MIIWIVTLFPLSCLATFTLPSLGSGSAFDMKLKTIMDKPINEDGGNEIINFELVETLREAVKGMEDKETETAFRMYLEAANFDDLFDDYSRTVHSAIDKRLNDALIIND